MWSVISRPELQDRSLCDRFAMSYMHTVAAIPALRSIDARVQGKNRARNLSG